MRSYSCTASISVHADPSQIFINSRFSFSRSEMNVPTSITSVRTFGMSLKKKIAKTPATPPKAPSVSPLFCKSVHVPRLSFYRPRRTIFLRQSFKILRQRGTVIRSWRGISEMKGRSNVQVCNALDRPATNIQGNRVSVSNQRPLQYLDPLFLDRLWIGLLWSIRRLVA